MTKTLSATFELVDRMRSEFIDLPGTRLSLAQASRLLSTDRATAREILDLLIREGLVFCDEDLYMRREPECRCA